MKSITTNTTGAQFLVLPKRNTDVETVVEISGAGYTGLSFTFQGSVEGSNYCNKFAIDDATGLPVSGGTVLSPANGSTYIWRMPSAGLTEIILNISALTAAGLTVSWESTPTASNVGLATPPTAAAVLNQVDTAITTVGAGVLIAAGIVGRLVTRTGPTAAFIDTTATAALIIAAMPNAQIGQAFEFTYQNSSYSVATLTGGVGVNAAATFGTVGPGCWATFLFTYSAAGTITVVQRQSGDNWIGLPSTSYSTGTTLTTFTAAQMTGGKLTVYTSTAATPGSIATPTAAAMFAAIQGAYVGLKWVFRVINDVITNSLTVTADATVTLSGKTTYVATPFGSMDFEMTFTSPTAATMKYVGGGQSTTV